MSDKGNAVAPVGLFEEIKGVTYEQMPPLKKFVKYRKYYDFTRLAKGFDDDLWKRLPYRFSVPLFNVKNIFDVEDVLIKRVQHTVEHCWSAWYQITGPSSDILHIGCEDEMDAIRLKLILS